MLFEPVSLDHAARLIGQRPWDVSRSAALLVEAHEAAIRAYGSATCIAGVDIYNVEAEAYGCAVPEPAGDGMPAPGLPPYSEPGELLVLKLDPQRDGRLPMLLEAAATLARRHPNVQVRLPLAGPFTIACHLLGMETVLCELMTDPEAMVPALLRLADNQRQLAQAAFDRGLGLTVFDSAVTPPLLPPALFANIVAPALARLLAGLPDASGTGVQLIIGGDTRPIQDTMLALEPAYVICPVETDQQAFLAAVKAHEGLTVRVNMAPAVFLVGQHDAAMAEARRALALAQGYAGTTVGALLPFDADPQQVRAVARLAQSLPDRR